MHAFPPQYMFQNEEAEAFPVAGCEEQWLICALPPEVEGNVPFLCTYKNKMEQ